MIHQSAAAAGVQRLFDLVRVRDSSLRCAFFYALGDTLVAEHLEQASRIAYGGDRRWARVVTLQVSEGHHAGAPPWHHRCCHGNVARRNSPCDAQQAAT